MCEPQKSQFTTITSCFTPRNSHWCPAFSSTCCCRPLPLWFIERWTETVIQSVEVLLRTNCTIHREPNDAEITCLVRELNASTQFYNQNEPAEITKIKLQILWTQFSKWSISWCNNSLRKSFVFHSFDVLGGRAMHTFHRTFHVHGGA